MRWACLSSSWYRVGLWFCSMLGWVADEAVVVCVLFDLLPRVLFRMLCIDVYYTVSTLYYTKFTTRNKRFL